MANISTTGLFITLIASNSFPTVPLLINDFADDADAIDSPEMTIGEVAMALNGELLNWQAPATIPVNLNVVAGSASDLRLSKLFDLNRVGTGKSAAGDIITMSVQYPGILIPTVLTPGAPLTYNAIISSAPNGRRKTRTYTFGFGNVVGN